MKRLKTVMEEKLPALVLAILVIQPVLDVLSYFLGEMGSNAFSTAIRFVLLAVVALMGFLLTDRRKMYYFFYGVAFLFWLLHAANCFRIGYKSPVADAANFLRILNFPIFTLSFITFFQKGKEIRDRIYLGFAVNMGEVLLFTALPWVLGRPMYTYSRLQVGVMGWASVPNAQSAIIVLAAPIAIYWAYRSGKYLLFLPTALLSFALMFYTGTKLTFYSVFIIAGAFFFLFALNLKKKCLKYALPMLAVLVLVFLFRGQSPMAERQRLSATAINTFSERVEKSLENSGADQETLSSIKGGVSLGAGSEEKLEKIRRGLTGVYTDPIIYGSFLEELHGRFGLYNVMGAYDYTTEPTILSDTRIRKTTFARLMWTEKDLLTRLLGFEYSDMLTEKEIYDLENDFPAVFYFCGYLGFALYMIFIAYLAFLILRAFFRDIAFSVRERKGKKGNPFLKGFGSFWKGVERFLTLEMGSVGMTFLLAVIAAQVSGNVLRRPNVTVYFAVAAACVYYLTKDLRKEEEPGDLSGGF